MTFLAGPPHGMAEVWKSFGEFKWTDLAKGNVQVDAQWESDNLVTLRNVCSTGLNIRLHRLVTDSFLSGLGAAMAAVPKYKIRMLGGFCARHKMHDPKRGLSIHAWGAAFDLNWDKNGVGKKAPHDIPGELVNAFEERGWQWGGKWKEPDYMHFQFATGC